MRSFAWLLAGSSLVATSAWADPTPTQAAVCVAALKARAEPIARRLQGGDAASEAVLLPIVTASFAFIGSVYKQGVRSKEANELLAAAEKEQAALPPAELSRRQDSCQAEGEQLLAQANYVERYFVARAAQARIDKLRKTKAS
jgi:hypothetical protein